MPDIRTFTYVLALEFCGTVEVEVEEGDDDASLREAAYDLALSAACPNGDYDVIDHEIREHHA